MLKRLCIIVKEWDERILARRFDRAHERVLDSFGEFGIRIGPVPIHVVKQKELQSIHAPSRDLTHMAHSTIAAMYAPFGDMILFGKSHYRIWSLLGGPLGIERILAHEYAHRLYSLIFAGFYMTPQEKRTYQDGNVLLLALPVVTEEIGPVEQLKKYVENVIYQIPGQTEDDKLKWKFNYYFNEMFAETVALYLAGPVNGDESWFTYAAYHREFVFGQDEQFAKTFEKTLHTVFFERMFSHGLKKVAIELPLSRRFAWPIFYRRWQYREWQKCQRGSSEQQ